MTVRPASNSFITFAKARNSSSVAIREGTGTPPAPLWFSKVDEPRPMAPAAIASRKICTICSSSCAVAARSDPASFMTTVLIAEWEANDATLGTTPLRRNVSRYWGKVSKSHWTPALSDSRDMASTSERLARIKSRVSGVAGAIPKPQLPITTVVTPNAGDGDAVGSHVSWAS